jgi:hypothetical protein
MFTSSKLVVPGHDAFKLKMQVSTLDRELVSTGVGYLVYIQLALPPRDHNQTAPISAPANRASLLKCKL